MFLLQVPDSSAEETDDSEEVSILRPRLGCLLIANTKISYGPNALMWRKKKY